jgi:ATP-dependent Clp protease protease subunit
MRFLAANDGKDVTVRFNTPGGDIFEGIAIYNAIQRHNGNVIGVVDAMAASAGAIALMACDKIICAADAIIMVHQAWTITGGNADDLRKEADILDKLDANLIELFAARTGKASDVIEPMIRNETWLSAADAIESGFAEEVQARKEPPPPDALTEEQKQKNAAASKYFQDALSRFENRTRIKLTA